ncbi:hypothetical protein Scep_000399 [Stephania cephalantha]|uniref:RanBP2-type domain-containing protein n=1 Tax=Stephania cephalantha TaxID=152367 RepID=A0AAP0L636_9MAGN
MQSIGLSGVCFVCPFCFGLGWAGWCAYISLPCLLVAALLVGCVWLQSIGCSNNNYASRTKCKKCGQPKEVAAMPAIAMPGASLPTYAHYFARAHGAAGLKMNLGMAANSTLQQSLLNFNWSLGGPDKYGLQSASGWGLGGSNGLGFSNLNNANQAAVPKGWRSGDWICNCGYHNYSSRLQCKKCNASMPPTTPSIPSSAAHGTKRLASEEIVSDWDNKRLNAGIANMNSFFPEFAQIGGSHNDPLPGAYASYSNGSSALTPNSQVHLRLPQFSPAPTLIGKGAKQWRDGDWMCKSCNNHNYASRSHCNRCKAQKDAPIPSES